MECVSSHTGGKIVNRCHGYFLATKPDTVGFGLNDSPSGLASYVLEKFVLGFGGTRCQNQDVLKCMENRVTLDELLTIVMLYWETNSMPSAARLYKEAINSENRPLQRYVGFACHLPFFDLMSIFGSKFENSRRSGQGPFVSFCLSQ